MAYTPMTFNQWARAFILACNRRGKRNNNYIASSVNPSPERNGLVCVVVNFRYPHELQGETLMGILDEIGGMQHSIWFKDSVTVELTPINALITLD